MRLVPKKKVKFVERRSSYIKPKITDRLCFSSKIVLINYNPAGMAELADALDLGSRF